MLAANRYTAIAMPLKYQTVSRQSTKCTAANDCDSVVFACQMWTGWTLRLGVLMPWIVSVAWLSGGAMSGCDHGIDHVTLVSTYSRNEVSTTQCWPYI